MDWPYDESHHMRRCRSVSSVMIGLVCGSLGVGSANAAILRCAARRLEGAGEVVPDVETVSSIPSFDPVSVDDPPAAVRHFRDALGGCDAVLIAAPEYAGGLAGSTKNALDWLVGDSTIHRMVIGVASAGTTGGHFAVEQLVRTISWQGGWVVATLGIAAPRTKSDEHGDYVDAATLVEIDAWVDTVVGAVEATPTHRLELLTAVVTPLGIDPARFGDL